MARLTPADPSATVEPASQAFGLVGVHRPVSRSLKLSNFGRSRLAVTDVWFEGPGADDYTVDLAPGARVESGESRLLNVAFRPSAEGARDAVLVIETNAPHEPGLRIPIQAEARVAEAQVRLDPIEFGHIEVGARRPLALSVTNPSELPIDVGASIAGTDALAFGADGPAALQPGESQRWAVWFDPVHLGDAAASLAFLPCEGCEPVALPLHGVGIDRALVFTPDAVAIGAVDVDRSASRSLVLANVSDMAVGLASLGLAANSDPGFSLDAFALPTDLDAHATLALKVRFSAVHLGAANGGVELVAASARNPRVVVPLMANGGGPEIDASTAALDYGEWPLGTAVTKRVHVQNSGGNGVPLTLDSIVVIGDADFTVASPPSPVALAAGAAIDLPVQFAPTALGARAAKLAIRSNDGAQPEVLIDLAGEGTPAGACALRVSPGSLDFGVVAPSTGSVLGFKIENTGSDLCVLTGFGIEDSAGGRFVLYGPSDTTYQLWPGDSMVRYLGFSGAAGAYRGSLGFGATGRPHQSIPLGAVVVDPVCVTANPGRVSWGAVQGVCGVATKQVDLINTCPAPVALSAIAVAQATDAEFALVGPPAVPVSLPPNGKVTVTVAYAAQVAGEVAAALAVATDAGTVEVPLFAENDVAAPVHDVFFQQALRQLDVLMVIDNSVSMGVNRTRVNAAAPAMVSALIQAGLDVHLSVTTTGIDPVVGGSCPGGADGGEAGRLFPVDGSLPRVLTMSTANLAGQLAQNLAVGTCHYLEEPFEAARRALSAPLVSGDNAGFYRPAAALALVFVNMEDDHSPHDVGSYAKFLRGMKGETTPERLKVVSVAPAGTACDTAGIADAPRFAALAQQLGAPVSDICSADFGAAFASVAGLAPQARSDFPLTSKPGPGGVQVSVDGVAQASGWTYEAAKNRIVFAPQSAPAPGARIEVVYAACP